MPSRRTFCSQACGAGLAAGLWTSPLGGADARPQDGPLPLPTIKGEADGLNVRVTIASTPLAEVGGFARIVSSAGSILVTRAGDQDFLAFSATCSHEACIITEGDAEAFICPCHGSRFDHRGNVVTRPAELSLYRLTSRFADQVLTISL